MVLEKGMYVRCPIVIEEADTLFPRAFVMAQVVSVDDFSQEVKVKVHDLNNCKYYYPESFLSDTFDFKEVRRCKAPIGCRVKTSSGLGYVISALTKKQSNSAFFQYYVVLDNNAYQLFSEEELCIDFNQMDYSPLQQLKDYEFQNPSWYASRFVVSNTNHILNNAAYGFRILAGSRVFLLPHQVVTIVRCLENWPIRYMLADEVGLGKTIEACGIVKILQSEQPDMRVLYIIPYSLIDQWKNELFYKFNIKASIYGEEKDEDDSNHILLPMHDVASKVEEITSKNQWNMVIVDETHRLLLDQQIYENVKDLSIKTNNVLLLSATPIQDRRQEYLKLLTLLSPDLYENMNLDTFSSIVEKQKKIQRKIHSLVDDVQEYQDYADSIKRRLVELAEELSDNMLMQLVNEIDLNSEDLNIDKTQQAIAYICEHYQLERRVIRNRRELLKDEMPSRIMIRVPYEPGTADQLYNEKGAIEAVLEWIEHNNNNDKNEYIYNTVQPIISALFSSPWALKEVINQKVVEDESLIMQSVDEWVNAANYELKQIDRALDEDPELIQGRLLKALDYLDQETCITESGECCKILVFTQFQSTLDVFYKMVTYRFGEDACVKFHAGMDRNMLEANVDAFQSEDGCRLMICDELGGEGRNFQNADMVIHLDIPWTANALEQRIGRLDRLGRNKDKEVASVVLYAEGTIEEQLLTLWDKGMKLFTQSLSGLEIITGELNKRISEALLDNINSGLANALDDIIEYTEEMRDSVEDEQIYDTEAMLYRPLTRVVENMLETYQGREDEIFADAMISWSSQAGLIPSNFDNDKDMVVFHEKNFSPASSKNAMLVPPDWGSYERYSLVKRQGMILGTFNRNIAIEREDILFYAPGDPIFEAIVKNAVNCNKGRASVFRLKSFELDFHGFFLVWNVMPDINKLLENGIKLQYLSQFRSYLPMEQILTVLPINNKSREVKPERIKDFILNNKTAIRQAIHWGERKGFTCGDANIQKFRGKYPDEKWSNVLDDVYKECLKIAKDEILALSDYSAASSEIKRIVQAHYASDIYFGRNHKYSEEIERAYNMVLKALRKPKLDLDSIALIRVVNDSDS